MLKAYFVGNVLMLEDDKIRLASLTIYNGHPCIAIHYITDEDTDQLLACLSKRKNTCHTCGLDKHDQDIL